MVVEIKGVGTRNKGAHLLLLAILQEFSRRNIKVEFCAAPGFGMDFFAAAKHGMKLKLDIHAKRLPWNKIFSLIPAKTRSAYGLVLDKEIDVVLDASGFAYGDFWGYKNPLRRLNNVLNGSLTPQAKKILLPQALGPFNDPKVRTSFQSVVNKVDCIFARDEQSLAYLNENFAANSKFFLAPDFTNLLEVEDAQTYAEGDVCIIPNYKMNAEGYESYFNFLRDSISSLNKLGKRPYFLIHEGEKDKAIATQINGDLGMDLPIVMEEDPLVIKRRIKSSDLVIVSRFHGLVSALCQGIPVVSTSWSHKYQMLLKDYHQLDALVDINTYEKDALEQLIRSKFNLPKDEYYILQKEHIVKQKERSKAMWDQVFSLING